MEKNVKQVLGIDVAQNELVSCLGKLDEKFLTTITSRKTFSNTKAGFEKMITWVEKLTIKEVPLHFVMEATGVYHQLLANYLYNKGYHLSIILPNKISNYFRTLSVKTVTDATMAEVIMKFGLERKLDNWEAPKDVYRNLQQLTRERSQLTDEKVVIKNQIHAEEAQAYTNKKSIQRSKKRLALITKQIKEIEVELKTLIAEDAEVKTIVLLLCSIPGIGMLTAATILGETNGFDLIRNKRQLTSYAGLDVKEKQSGTSVKGKPRISKKGNKHLRKCMHLPALSAIKHDGRWKAIFTRIVSKQGIKMKAAVAIQRKLLEMTYTIFKTQKPYDKNYFVSKIEQEVEIENIVAVV